MGTPQSWTLLASVLPSYVLVSGPGAPRSDALGLESSSAAWNLVFPVLEESQSSVASAKRASVSSDGISRSQAAEGAGSTPK